MMTSGSENHEFEQRRRGYEASVLSIVWEHKDSMNREPTPMGIEIVGVSLSGDPPKTRLTVEWTDVVDPQVHRESFPVWTENESMDWAGPAAHDILLAIAEGIARGDDS
jgi:hypothetical protein